MSHAERERRGRWAEQAAALLLALKGYRILARRFATHVGEIDLVARRGATLAFVEVKRRPSRGAALEAVLPRQRRRIERAALLFLARHPALAASCAVRFDVVTVAGAGWWSWPRHLVDAWRPEEAPQQRRPA